MAGGDQSSESDLTTWSINRGRSRHVNEHLHIIEFEPSHGCMSKGTAKSIFDRELVSTKHFVSFEQVRNKQLNYGSRVSTTYIDTDPIASYDTGHWSAVRCRMQKTGGSFYHFLAVAADHDRFVALLEQEKAQEIARLSPSPCIQSHTLSTRTTLANAYPANSSDANSDLMF